MCISSCKNNFLSLVRGKLYQITFQLKRHVGKYLPEGILYNTLTQLLVAGPPFVISIESCYFIPF